MPLHQLDIQYKFLENAQIQWVIKQRCGSEPHYTFSNNVITVGYMYTIDREEVGSINRNTGVISIYDDMNFPYYWTIQRSTTGDWTGIEPISQNEFLRGFNRPQCDQWITRTILREILTGSSPLELFMQYPNVTITHHFDIQEDTTAINHVPPAP